MTSQLTPQEQDALAQVKADAESIYRLNPHHEGERVPVVVEDPKPRRPQKQRPLTLLRPQIRHTWQKDDTIVAVGQKYGVDAEEILDLNLIEEHELTPGIELKIPKRRGGNVKREIRYEVLDQPIDMHVNKPEGIQKYAFGNVSDPNSVSGSGHFPLGTRITIHGIAHVPVGEDDTLAYYMDHHAFGDYRTTKKVAWNIGYAWSELTEGEYVPPAEAITEPEKTILDEPDEPISIFDDEPEPEPQPEPEAPPQKDGILMPLNPDYTPEKFLYETDMTMHELHGRHKPIHRRRLDPVWIIGTFFHEGVEYYQPGRNVGEVVQSGLLWPIPMDAILPESEVFDYSLKRRPLTRQEKWYQLLMRISAQYIKFGEYIKQKQTKE